MSQTPPWDTYPSAPDNSEDLASTRPAAPPSSRSAYPPGPGERWAPDRSALPNTMALPPLPPEPVFQASHPYAPPAGFPPNGLPPGVVVPALPPGGDHHDRGGRRRGQGRRGRRAAAVAIVLLILALLLSLGTGGYLFIAQRQWQDTSTQWETQARDLGNQVADLNASLDGANTELTTARSQLTDAQQRITDLTNEKAQLGDQNAASGLGLDYQKRISEAAGKVAAALNQCTRAQSQLIGYLNDRSSYDPNELDQFSQQVQELCAAATDANTALQRELGR